MRGTRITIHIKIVLISEGYAQRFEKGYEILTRSNIMKTKMRYGSSF